MGRPAKPGLGSGWRRAARILAGALAALLLALPCFFAPGGLPAVGPVGGVLAEPLATPADGGPTEGRGETPVAPESVSPWGQEAGQETGPDTPPPAAPAEEDPPPTRISYALPDGETFLILQAGQRLDELAGLPDSAYLIVGYRAVGLAPVEWQTDEQSLAETGMLEVLEQGGMLTLQGKVALGEGFCYLEDDEPADLMVTYRVWVARAGGPVFQMTYAQLKPDMLMQKLMVPLGSDVAYMNERMRGDEEKHIQLQDNEGYILHLPATVDWSLVDTGKTGVYYPFLYELPEGVAISETLRNYIAVYVVDPDIIDLTYTLFAPNGNYIEGYWIKEVENGRMWLAKEAEKGGPGEWWQESGAANISTNQFMLSFQAASSNPFWKWNEDGSWTLLEGVYYMQIRSDDGDSSIYTFELTPDGTPCLMPYGGDVDGGDATEQKPPPLTQPPPGPSGPGEDDSASDTDGSSSSSSSSSSSAGSGSSSGSGGDGAASQSNTQSGSTSSNNTGVSQSGSAGPGSGGATLPQSPGDTLWWRSESASRGGESPRAEPPAGQNQQSQGHGAGQSGPAGYGYSDSDDPMAQGAASGSGPPAANAAGTTDGQPGLPAPEQVTETATTLSGLRLREMMALQPAGVLFQKNNISLWLDCDFLKGLALADQTMLTVRLEADPASGFSVSAAVDGQPLNELPDTRVALYNLPTGRGALSVLGPDGAAPPGLEFNADKGEAALIIGLPGRYTLLYEKEPLAALAAQTEGLLPQRTQGGPATALLVGSVTLPAAGATGVFLLRGRLSALLRKIFRR